MKTILQYPAHNSRVGCSRPVFMVVAVILCFVPSIGLYIWEILWGSQFNPQLWDRWQDMFFTLLPTSCTRKKKKITTPFSYCSGQNYNSRCSRSRIFLCRNSLLAEWLLVPSFSCLSHTTAGTDMSECICICCLCTELKEKASSRTWLSLSSKTQLTPRLTRPRELILPITGCFRNGDAG